MCRSFQADGVVARRGTEEIRLDTRLNVRDTARYKAVRPLNRIVAASLLAIAAVSSSMAEVPDQARAAIDRILGGKGTYVTDEGAYKVVLPREAATIVLDYQTLAVDPSTHRVYAPEQEEDGQPVARIVVYESGSK